MEKVRTAVGDEQPSSSAGKYLAGDRHLDDMYRYVKLNKEIEGNKNFIPRRKKSDRLVDHLIEQLNKLEEKAEKQPGGNDDAKLDQLKVILGVEDTLDMALKLAEFEMERIKKKKLKNILVDDEGLNMKRFDGKYIGDPLTNQVEDLDTLLTNERV